MSLERWFRLSAYLTLGLSCAALVFAEVPFLPDLQICLAPVLLLLVLSWWVEGRWRLPNWGANILGVLIAAGGAAWLATQLTEENSLLMRVPLHLALLPYMGPLVMAALLVKVFGPRDSGDFWRLQGLGLMQIGLGCVLDGGPVFGGLMAVYLASALACLALRYRLSTLDNRPAPSAWWLLSFLPRWTLLIVGPALLLFLLTPRRDSSAWEPLNGVRSGSQSRGAGGEEINLNGDGHIELDDEAALQVVAVDAAGRPKLDLPDDQYWRGGVLEWYDKGKWMARRQLVANPQRIHQRDLPDFGPGQFFLTFSVRPRQAGALVLAEPIRFGSPSARLPVRTLSEDGRPRLFSEQWGTVLPLQLRGDRELQYRQVVPTQTDPLRTAAESIPGAYRERLIHEAVPGLQEWTIALLRRLSEQPRSRIPAGVRAALANPRVDFPLDCDHWEATARVLADYLANSGDFTYTLDITRREPSLDPVMDFLVNVKKGHCELYATALALMLRSLDIPARVVKGFRGFDRQGDGVYVVRHRHAHAWVEILVPRSSSRPPPSFDWLTLDPTPAESAVIARRFSLDHLWEEVQRMCLQSWQSLIVEYNADNQADLWDTLRFGRPLAVLLELALALSASFAAWLILRRLRRRRRGGRVRLSDTTVYYLRLVRLLRRHASLRPSLGQTPREYGEMARTFLLTRPAAAALAELPIHVVNQFYRARFGGQPLSETERQALHAELDRFAAAIRAAGVRER